MFQAVRTFFADPAHQALGWAALGIAGVGLAAAGLFLMTSANDPGGADYSSTTTPTPARSASPTALPSPTLTPAPPVSPSPLSSPSPSATTAPGGSSGGGDSTNPTPVPATPEPPPPTPTAVPVVLAGGPYCNTISQSGVPTRVFGTFTVAGASAPAGALVALAFDGVLGPANPTPEAGGYRIDFAPAGSDCANRVGALITLVYNGASYATGHTVGDAASRAGFLQVPLAIP